MLFKTDFLFPPSYLHKIKNCLHVSWPCLPFVRYFVETLLVKIFCWNFISEDILLRLYSWKYFLETLLVKLLCWNFIGEYILLKLYWWIYFDKLHWPTCATHFTSPRLRLGSLKIIVSPNLGYLQNIIPSFLERREKRNR